MGGRTTDRWRTTDDRWRTTDGWRTTGGWRTTDRWWTTDDTQVTDGWQTGDRRVTNDGRVTDGRWTGDSRPTGVWVVAVVRAARDEHLTRVKHRRAHEAAALNSRKTGALQRRIAILHLVFVRPIDVHACVRACVRACMLTGFAVLTSLRGLLNWIMLSFRWLSGPSTSTFCSLKYVSRWFHSGCCKATDATVN